MTSKAGRMPILLAEDDPDDHDLTQRALRAAGIFNPLVTVSDGEELLDYLYRRGRFSGRPDELPPCFILLDLQLPRVDGREALRRIKEDGHLRKIPVVVMTSLRDESLIGEIYDRGANSYLVKPRRFEDWLRVFRGLGKYWLEVVELPPERDLSGLD